MFSKKRKKSLQNFFSGDVKEKDLQNNFSGDLQNLAIKKIVLSSSQEEGNDRGLEALKPRTSKCVFEDSTSSQQSNMFYLLVDFFLNMSYNWYVAVSAVICSFK